MNGSPASRPPGHPPGTGHFVTTVTDAYRHGGTHVGTNENVLFRYEPARAGSSSPPGGRGAVATAVGEPLPGVRLPPTFTRMAAMIPTGTRDLSPGHHDRAYAHGQGADDVDVNTTFFHGKAWAGPGGWLERRTLRMRAPTCVGATLRTDGRVTPRHRRDGRRVAELAIAGAGRRPAGGHRHPHLRSRRPPGSTDMTTVRLHGYPHQLAGHCGSGALRDLVEWAGLGWGGPPSEGLIFGLGGGLAFMYLRVAGITPPVYLAGRNADFEIDLCDRLDIDVDERRTDDPELAWRWVVDELDGGRPVMIHADIAELPYLRVRLSNTRHDVVVIGYDDDRGIAWVVDNDREEVQQVPLEALARARSSTGFPDPVRHATYPMRFPDTLPELRDAARDAAAASASTLRHGAGVLFDPLGLPPTAVVGRGLAGVATFAEDVARWPDLLADGELDQALRAVWVFTEKAGTGGGMFRGLQASFCADVARLTGDDGFAAAAAAYRRCADGWSRLARTCREHPDDHAAIAEQAGELPALERTAVTTLEHAADGPR